MKHLSLILSDFICQYSSMAAPNETNCKLDRSDQEHGPPPRRLTLTESDVAFESGFLDQS